MKILNVNLEVADFRKLFTHLKFVRLTRVMSQIEAKTKKSNLQVGFGIKKLFVCLPQ